MRGTLAIILAVSMLLVANAYDSSYNEGFDGSGIYFEYSNEDGTTLLSSPLYDSDQYYFYGSQPQQESTNGYDSAVPYNGGEYSAPYSLWIVVNGQMTQYLQCPPFTQLQLVAYSPGGPATVSEIYPDGRQISKIFQFEPGNNEIAFVADEPGRHTLRYEIYGQISNAVIIDVGSSEGGLPGPSYPDEINHPPEVRSLKADPNIGYPGAAITFTADAYDQDSDQILYKFWITSAPDNGLDGVNFDDYQPQTDWTQMNSWTWYPQESDFGINAVMIDVRDGSNQPQESWDDFSETLITICHHDPSLDSGLENCPSSPYIGSFGKGDRKTSRPKGSGKSKKIK